MNSIIRMMMIKMMIIDVAGDVDDEDVAMILFLITIIISMTM